MDTGRAFGSFVAHERNAAIEKYSLIAAMITPRANPANIFANLEIPLLSVGCRRGAVTSGLSRRIQWVSATPPSLYWMRRWDMVTSRIWFTAKQKAELWERWKNGQSVLAISRALERRNKTGVQRIVALNGGIAPAPRCRAVAALKLEEREEISRGIAAGRSVRRIARGLKRSPSTISREIRRNGGLQAYRANRADRRAWARARRSRSHFPARRSPT